MVVVIKIMASMHVHKSPMCKDNKQRQMTEILKE